MFTKLKHFERAWAYESENTLKVLRVLTDASLSQAVAPQERTLGRIAWHLTTSVPEMVVPGVYGPAHEEWAGMGMTAPAV